MSLQIVVALPDPVATAGVRMFHAPPESSAAQKCLSSPFSNPWPPLQKWFVVATPATVTVVHIGAMFV